MTTITKLYGLQKEMRRTFREAEVGTYASGAAFFLFLSVIPMVMIVSGMLPHDLIGNKEFVNISQAVIPDKIYRFLLSIVDSYHGSQVTLLSVSAVVVVWSASKGVLALIRGLNHIYEVEETRGYILLRLKASFYTVFLLLAILLSAGVLVFGNTLAKWVIPDNGPAASLWRVFGWVRHIFVAGMISIVFCTMYSPAEQSGLVEGPLSRRCGHIRLLDAVFVWILCLHRLFWRVLHVRQPDQHRDRDDLAVLLYVYLFRGRPGQQVDHRWLRG